MLSCKFLYKKYDLPNLKFTFINRRRSILNGFVLFFVCSFIYKTSFDRFWDNTVTPFFYTNINKQSMHWLIVTPNIQLEQYFHLFKDNMSIIFIVENKDIKTPLKNENLILLNSQNQSQFSFRSKNLRNLAYLLAIKNGARFIYELTSNISFRQHENVQHLAFRRPRSPFVNIYPTFTGNFTDISPGLPQDEWLNITQDGWSSIRTIDNYQETIHPLIEQDILIYSQNRELFVNHPPVAIEPLTFAPFTDENILFKYDAFWALNLFESKSIVWRSWWVQRLLADVNGHLTFASSFHQQNSSLISNIRKSNIKEDANVGKLVRYLSTWKSTKLTLVERIEDLFRDLFKEKLCNKGDLKTIQDWIKDLQKLKYIFPPIKTLQSAQRSSKTIRQRRTAVCMTGLIECIEEAWRPTCQAIRTHIQGDMDIFMYLSSTEPIIDQLPVVPLNKRIAEALRYSNFTVKVLFENLPKLDPHFPPNCTTDESVDQPPHKIPRYYQQLFGLSNCFSLVRDYEKKHGIQYDLMVRSRADIAFLKLPSTFDRKEPYNINTTLILPPNRYSSKVDDGFAIGPIEAVEVYMNRYYSFQKCITRDLHPERYLHFYLTHRKVNLTIDQETLVGHIAHGPNRCH